MDLRQLSTLPSKSHMIWHEKRISEPQRRHADVTLASEDGQQLKAHRVILASARMLNKTNTLIY